MDAITSYIPVLGFRVSVAFDAVQRPNDKTSGSCCSSQPFKELYDDLVPACIHVPKGKKNNHTLYSFNDCGLLMCKVLCQSRAMK